MEVLDRLRPRARHGVVPRARPRGRGAVVRGQGLGPPSLHAVGARSPPVAPANAVRLPSRMLEIARWAFGALNSWNAVVGFAAFWLVWLALGMAVCGYLFRAPASPPGTAATPAQSVQGSPGATDLPSGARHHPPTSSPRGTSTSSAFRSLFPQPPSERLVRPRAGALGHRVARRAGDQPANYPTAPVPGLQRRPSELVSEP
jgi:hypothetical protein